MKRCICVQCCSGLVSSAKQEKQVASAKEMQLQAEELSHQESHNNFHFYFFMCCRVLPCRVRISRIYSGQAIFLFFLVPFLRDSSQNKNLNKSGVSFFFFIAIG